MSASVPLPAVSSAPGRAGRITFALIGGLVAVELTSGVLQGYYVPLISRITAHLGVRDADYNWFEAAQLLLSAIAVPVLARLGDVVGHKRMLLITTVLTALATWGTVVAGGFWTYLIAFALQGFYVAWLPLEVALVTDRTRRSGQAATLAARAAGYLVVALEVGAIIGALGGAQVLGLVGGSIPATLAVPAVIVTLLIPVVLFGVKESEPDASQRLDTAGFVLLALALLGVTSSLSFLHLNGLGTWWAWALMAVGLALFVPFARHASRTPSPAIDLAVLRRPSMWPIQATALLGGVSLLGAQVPLSTFAATDPAVRGFGLGLAPGPISYVTGGYLLSLMAGAVLLPRLAGRTGPRTGILVGAIVNAVGYLLFLPLHGSLAGVMIALYLAGLGVGGLVAALPAAAAAAAPVGQAGIAAGLTNTAKTVGGAIASAVFAMVLSGGGSEQSATGGQTTLGGYLTVWTICGLTAAAAAVVLLAVPRGAFTDASVEVR